MKAIVTAFARNRVFANILMIMILFAGSMSAFMLNRETFPSFSVDMVSVQVVYPGADPEEVEEGISRKIEEAIDGVEGIKRYTTRSSEGLGRTTIEILERYDNASVIDEVRNAIDSISTFPVDAERPTITELKITENVIDVALSGPLTERQLKEWGERLRDELLRLPEISQARLEGVRDYEIGIEISETALREYGLTFEQVAAAVAQSSLNLAGGTIRTDGEEVRVRTIGRRYTGEEFGNIVVVSRPTGEIITLDRVAAVRDDFVENPMVFKLNGERAVNIRVFKTQDEDAITIARVVREWAAEKNAELPAGVGLSVMLDWSELIDARLSMLVRNGLIGLSLVFLVLWLFLDFRLSFWAAMGIPISLGGALFLMFLVGASLNMISLFALIMVIGIIVDDAIVVSEAIYVHRKRGDGPLQAAVNGTMEVGLPVIAAITTTCVAFAPLLYLTGVFGKFIAILPVAVIAALLMSLVEALILLPAHLNHLDDPNRPPKAGRVRAGVRRIHGFFGGGLERFAENRYKPFLHWSLHHRYITLATAIAIVLFTVGMVRGGFIRFEVFPEIDGNLVQASIEFPNGTPADITEEAVTHIREGLQRVAARMDTRSGEPMIRNLVEGVGSGGGMGGGPRQGGPHTGYVRVELLENERRGIASSVIEEAWNKEIGNIPGAVALSFAGVEAGPGGADIEIWLQGEDFDMLLAAADDFTEKLASFEGLYQISSDFRPGRNEMRLALKPEARTLGLTTADLARQVNAGYFGREALRLQRGRDDIRVRVRYTADERSRLADVESIRIRTPDGREVPLLSVADIDFAPGFSTITRTDGLRRVVVTAQAGRGANSNEILDYLQHGGRNGNEGASVSFFEQVQTEYPGITLEIEGQQREFADSLGSLFVTFPLAMLGIFVIIATIFRSYFQPFVVLLIIPFAVIGAIYGHLLMGLPVSLMSMFGIVALAGVVVNNAIVFIEAFNHNIAAKQEFFDALVSAGARRFRAIFLTTISTCGGLMPIILERDLQAQIVVPMAVSLAAGVAFGTLLTLVLMPCLIAMGNDVRCWAHYYRHGDWPARELLEPGRTRDDDPEIHIHPSPEPQPVGG